MNWKSLGYNQAADILSSTNGGVLIVLSIGMRLSDVKHWGDKCSVIPVTQPYFKKFLLYLFVYSQSGLHVICYEEWS